MKGSRSSRIVQMAIAKANVLHEAYAEYDAKGKTPALSTVLENVKEKFHQLSQETFGQASCLDPKPKQVMPVNKYNPDNQEESDDSSRWSSSDNQLLISFVNKDVSKETRDTSAHDTNNLNDCLAISTLEPVIQNEYLNVASSTSNCLEFVNEQQNVLIWDQDLNQLDGDVNAIYSDNDLLAIPVSEAHTNLDNQESVENKIVDEETPQDVNKEDHTKKAEKKRKLRSAEEKEQRNREKHPMLEPCSGKCKNKRCSELTDDDRKKIWNEFWSFPYAARRQWLCRNIRIYQVKRRTVEPKNMESQENENERSFLKNETRDYLLPKPSMENKQLRVCKRMLLNTLGYTNDSVLTELSQASKKTAIGDVVGENRGRSIPSNKIDRKVIVSHIESFGPSLSHYRRYNAPLCRYLSRELTIQIMHEDLLSKFPDFCKIETYRKTLKSMNISLKMPKGDRCSECLFYESEIDNAKKMNQAIDPDLLTKKEMHELKASQAKTLYNVDKSRNQALNERIFSMDLQKVMLLPVMPHIKDSFFISRLVVYNETFATLSSNSNYKSITVLWHEALQGRNADSIVDTIVTAMNLNDNASVFTFWADNCTSQNKNWILYSSLVHIVNQQTGPQQVIIRYLTKGHTHMSADSVHGNIEKAIKAAGSVFNFDELVRIIQNCRKNLTVEKLEIFRDWKSKKRINRISKTKNNVEESPVFQPPPQLLQNIVEAKFVRGNRNLLYKNSFEDDYTEYDFLQKKFVPTSDLPALKPTYRGINAQKKAKILSDLVPKIKNINQRAFWLNLPESEQSADLLRSAD